jgi:hypothetical protein
MPQSPIPVPAFAALGIQGGDWLTLGRLMREDATTHDMVACIPADVSSITRWLIDLTDGTTVVSGPTALNVTTTILAALSTGTVWTRDTVGFNFRDQIAGALLTSLPGVEVRYSITLSDGTVVKVHIDLNLKQSN